MPNILYSADGQQVRIKQNSEGKIQCENGEIVNQIHISRKCIYTFQDRQLFKSIPQHPDIKLIGTEMYLVPKLSTDTPETTVSKYILIPKNASKTASFYNIDGEICYATAKKAKRKSQIRAARLLRQARADGNTNTESKKRKRKNKLLKKQLKNKKRKKK